MLSLAQLHPGRIYIYFQLSLYSSLKKLSLYYCFFLKDIIVIVITIIVIVIILSVNQLTRECTQFFSNNSLSLAIR